MPLESIVTEGINVRELALERPENAPELAFDPKRDISEHDLVEMLKPRKEWSPLYVAADVALLFPHLREHLAKPQLLSEGLDYVKKTLSIEKNADSIIHATFPLLVLFPDQRDRIVSWSKKEKDALKQSVRHPLGIGLANRVELKLMFPETKDEDLLIPSKEALDSLFQDTAVSLQEKVTCLAALKILSPKYVEGMKIGDQWERWKFLLDDLRKKALWKDFASLACELHFLSAKEVCVTERGIEVINETRKPLGEKFSPLPELRSFVASI